MPVLNRAFPKINLYQQYPGGTRERREDWRMAVLMGVQVLSFVEKNKRCSIRQRWCGGIETAKLKGIWLRRPEKPLLDNFEQEYDQWKTGEVMVCLAAVL